MLVDLSVELIYLILSNRSARWARISTFSAIHGIAFSALLNYQEV
jgi:hypothetical protein